MLPRHVSELATTLRQIVHPEREEGSLVLRGRGRRRRCPRDSHGDDKVTKVEAETATRIKAGRKLRLARCHHASRRCGGSMGGTASAVPRLRSKRQLPERQCHFGTSQDCPDPGATGQTDEEPLQHHEAVQPHEAWFHDQYSCQQTCRQW